ncbi:MAG: hypothetical protein AAB686_01570 [Patescibacteria group bacterium]
MTTIKLCLEPSVQTRLEARLALELRGGATESCFPEVEALLISGGRDYQEALQYVASRKDMSRYHSVMDFLFCEIFTVYRGACKRCYADRGPQLKDMVSVSTLLMFNSALLKALEMAVEYHRERRRGGWEAFRWSVLAQAA